MAIEKKLLDQLLAGRDRNEVFARAGLLDDLKKALSERILNAELDEHLEDERVEGRQHPQQRHLRQPAYDQARGGLRDKLLHPDVIAAFVEEFQQEYNKAMQTEHADRRLREAELAKVEQSIVQIVNAIADGMYHPSKREKMTTLEARKIAIQDEFLRQLGEEKPLRLQS